MKAKPFKIVLLISVLVLVPAWFMKDSFPDKSEILEDVYLSPVQEKVDLAAFELEKEGVVYTIQPLYEYELYAMVVSYHHCGVWWDAYHRGSWKDYINIKDLCLVWGENIETEVYKDMKFRSNAWTCNYSWPNGEVYSRFCQTCLSNNHILTDDRRINKKLLDTEIGDQIHLSGYLAGYSHSNGTFNRGTSTVRTDTGNGACETIFVEDYEILKKANTGWRTIYRLSKYTAALALLALLGVFIFSKSDPG